MPAYAPYSPVSSPPAKPPRSSRSVPANGADQKAIRVHDQEHQQQQGVGSQAVSRRSSPRGSVRSAPPTPSGQSDVAKSVNSMGLPLRPGRQDCKHFLSRRWCAYGRMCKYNHPEMPVQMQVQMPVQMTTAGTTAGTAGQHGSMMGFVSRPWVQYPMYGWATATPGSQMQYAMYGWPAPPPPQQFVYYHQTQHQQHRDKRTPGTQTMNNSSSSSSSSSNNNKNNSSSSNNNNNNNNANYASARSTDSGASSLSRVGENVSETADKGPARS